ncbi:MAG: FAD-binding oxidoreductase [Myxococcales bacterium]|jgi:alkyldihydroxyacetonephosphate synthase
MTRPVHRLPARDVPAATPEARALYRDASRIVAGRASIEPTDRLAYARDLWPKALVWARSGQTPSPPELVVWPETLEEVRELTRLAARLAVPVVPFGAGSGLCGGTLALRGGIAMDLKRMRRVVALDPDALEVECEAGILGERLERELGRQGLTTGHFPSSIGGSTLGGWLATRGAGQCSGRYGKIEDMVASLTVVDGRGEVLVAARRPQQGWLTPGLFLGSEGTLGTICRARLHLVSAPQARAFQAFAFSGVRSGIDALRAILRAGLRPAVARLYDPVDTQVFARGYESGAVHKRGLLRDRFDEGVLLPLERLASRAVGAAAFGLNRAAELLRECLLLLVFEGDSELVELEAEEAARVCAAGGGEDRGAEPAQTWLQNRYAEPFRQSRVFDAGAFLDRMEVAGTWERAVEIYERVRDAAAPLALVGCRFDHARVEGCALEFTFVGAAGSLGQVERRYDDLWRSALAAAHAAGAAFSHHRGVGVARLNAFKSQVGDGLLLVRALKATFDPAGIMNPGKLGD